MRIRISRTQNKIDYFTYKGTALIIFKQLNSGFTRQRISFTKDIYFRKKDELVN